MSIQTINVTNRTKGVGYGTQLTRYVLSPAQKSFVETLQLWLIVNFPNKDNFPLDEQTVKEYQQLLKNVRNNNGYEEFDAVALNHLRSLYIRHKELLPF